MTCVAIFLESRKIKIVFIDRDDGTLDEKERKEEKVVEIDLLNEK
jgi:hypothetical protein